MHKFEYDHIIVRYGELSTKGKNRIEFMRQLTHNIKKRLKDYSNLTYNTLHDGLFIKLNGEDYDSIKIALKDVFGYSYFSGALRCEKNIDSLKEMALNLIKNYDVKTFKINCKRHDKNFPLVSDQIKRIVAGHILHNTDLLVDVHNPELSVNINVDKDYIYIFDEKNNGYGGFPTGINGKALVMTSGGIDSPVACFLTMKRGMRIECIHFASMPYTSKQALDKVLSLVKTLSVFQEEIIVHVINFTDIQLAIYKTVDEPYCITIMRRMMYRIADTIAKSRKINVICNGESLGQVASQTPESMSVISRVSDTLVLRPLCMNDKLEIIDLAKKINTYETSILPYEDCCTIFEPKNPVTKPKLSKCEYFESLFDYKSLLEKSISEDQVLKISYKDKGEEDGTIF